MLYFGRLRCCCWIDKRSSWNLSLWGLASQYHACILKGYFRMPTWASTLPKATSPSRQPLLTALLLWHLPMGCRQENDGGQCRRWAQSLWVLPGLPSWARGQKNRKKGPTVTGHLPKQIYDSGMALKHLFHLLQVSRQCIMIILCVFGPLCSLVSCTNLSSSIEKWGKAFTVRTFCLSPLLQRWFCPRIWFGEGRN